jgi:hypothetical protein
VATVRGRQACGSGIDRDRNVHASCATVVARVAQLTSAAVQTSPALGRRRVRMTAAGSPRRGVIIQSSRTSGWRPRGAGGCRAVAERQAGKWTDPRVRGREGNSPTADPDGPPPIAAMRLPRRVTLFPAASSTGCELHKWCAALGRAARRRGEEGAAGWAPARWCRKDGRDARRPETQGVSPRDAARSLRARTNSC